VPATDPNAAEVFYRINTSSPSQPPSVNALMRRLRALQLPTLLLWGQNDPWIVMSRAQRLKAIYPEVRPRRRRRRWHRRAFGRGASGGSRVLVCRCVQSRRCTRPDSRAVCLLCPCCAPCVSAGRSNPWLLHTTTRNVDATRARPTPNPQASLVSIDAGHCGHDEAPAQANEALLNWLAGLRAAKA
jgi:pimeloyl-ACP methyl ester carboxylesterase